MTLSNNALTYKHLLEALSKLNLGEDNAQSVEGFDIEFDNALSRLLDKMDACWYKMSIEEIAQVEAALSGSTIH